jgi:SAM-dependent methyltransferase
MKIECYKHNIDNINKRKKEKIGSILKNGKKYNIQNDAICFLPGKRLPIQTAGSGFQGKVQNLLKQYGRIYYLLLKIFKPVYSGPLRRKAKKILDLYNEQNVILNIGSGPTYYMGRKDIINIDSYAFKEVDIVADASDIPLKNNSVDLILNLALLEHVENPKEVVDEMYRIIKPNGDVLCFLPFIQPYHAAPNDYQRWTIQGSKILFSCFDKIEISIAQGPTSGLLWVLQEWLSILFSFGSKTLHDIVFLVLVVVTAPLKLLDIFMVKLPCVEKISGGFYIIAKKLQ